MLESAWLFVGVIAFLWTVMTLLAAVYADPVDNGGDALATVGGIVGFVLWGVWTFGTLEILIVTSSGTELTFSHPELTILGIAMALVPGYIALTGPIEMIGRARDPGVEDV